MSLRETSSVIDSIAVYGPLSFIFLSLHDARGRVPSFVSVTVERTLRARTRVKKRPHVRRACTRDMHNRGCTVAILEIAVCFPPGGDRTRDLRSYTPAVSRYIFSAGALKNARPYSSSPRLWPGLPDPLSAR